MKRSFLIICILLLKISFCQLRKIDQYGTINTEKITIRAKPYLVAIPTAQRNSNSIQKESKRVISKPLRIFKPLKNLVPTSGFGNRIHPVTGNYKFHAGMDFKAYYESVYNIANGRVAKCGYDPISGNYIVIEHGIVSSAYCHLSEVYVLPGEYVEGGSIIAKTGNTGRSTGPHLHFSLYYKKRRINPVIYKRLVENSTH